MDVTYSALRQTSRDFKSETSSLSEGQTSASRISQSPKEEIRTLDPQEPAVAGQRTMQSWNIRAVSVMQQLKQSLCSTKMKGTVYPVLGCGIVTGGIVYLALSYAPTTSHLEEPPKVILGLCGSVAAGMLTLLGIKCRPCVTHLINSCGQLCTRGNSVHEGSHGRDASEEKAGVSTLEEQELFEQGAQHLMEFVKKTGLNKTELCGENALDYYDVLNFHAGKTLNVNIEGMSEGAKALHEKIPALNLGKDQCRWVAAFIEVSKEFEREEETELSDPILLG